MKQTNHLPLHLLMREVCWWVLVGVVVHARRCITIGVQPTGCMLYFSVVCLICFGVVPSANAWRVTLSNLDRLYST